MNRFASAGRRYLPILTWGSDYNKQTAGRDLLAAVIVTLMLIPQSLAYALLAGLPPEMGIYASMAPIVLYAVFGTSSALAVGPVAIVSLLTASAIAEVAEPGSSEAILAAITLAFLSGAFLLLMGIFRLGFLANFLSQPVISGFITASGVLIAASQLRHILGIDAGGHNLPEIIGSLLTEIANTNYFSAAIGLTVVSFLFWSRAGMAPLLRRYHLPDTAVTIVSRSAPVFVIAFTVALAWALGLDERGVRLVGAVPSGLPSLTWPSFSWRDSLPLLSSAIMLSVIGFVESVSIAQTLAAKRHESIVPNQELIGLGAANIGAAFTGGFPVTGGFSRSVVNFDAGAATPAAGIFTAVGLAFAALYLTPLITFLPKATLAATIIVAVVSLIDWSILKRAWVYSKADFSAVIATVVLTLMVGVEVGVGGGVLLSLLTFLYRTSRPHIAIVGRVPNTEHFRNVQRHEVITNKRILSIRIDESLYFPNARYLEEKIVEMALAESEIEHVVLLFSAVNSVDLSALESMRSLNRRLSSANIQLHFSEVKGPVMDQLKRADFLASLSGEVFLSQYKAIQTLEGTHTQESSGPP